MGIDLYFGSRFDQLYPKSLSFFADIERIKKNCDSEYLIINHDHVSESIRESERYALDSVRVISEKNQVHKTDLFNQSGEALITNQPDLLLGLLTADELPLFLFDSKNGVIGAVRLSLEATREQFAKKVIYQMGAVFDSRPSDIICYFGPGSRACCVQVSPEFYQSSQDRDWQLGFTERDQYLYFENGLVTHMQLLHIGILPGHINTENFSCTVCSDKFCSQIAQEYFQEYLGMKALSGIQLKSRNTF